MTQPLLIGGYDIGEKQDLKPFMIPEKAFTTLLNTYVFRQRVNRKSGYKKMGRLRRVISSQIVANVSLVAGANNFNLFTLLGLPTTGQLVLPTATPIVLVYGLQTLTNSLSDNTFVVAPVGNITAATVDYLTGDIVITATAPAGPANLTISLAYYPTLPVMGERTYEQVSRNAESTIFFDTVYAYSFNGAVFSELTSTLPTTWTGSDSDFFWTTNYFRDSASNDLFWATNNIQGFHGYAVTLFANAAGPPFVVDVTAAGNTFQLGDTVFFNNLAGSPATANNFLTGVVTVAGNPTFTITGTAAFTNGAVTGTVFSPNRNVNGDGIRYYNSVTWANFNPNVNGVTNVLGCLIIIPYKGRLVLLNTLEGSAPGAAVNYPQRARWSQNGTPLDYSNGWRDDLVGRGGFIDAATSEQIVGCGFIKDQLIVYFERSTWVLAYTGNEVLPFIWQRINSELGCESTFSSTLFDNRLLAMGNIGVHAANGNTVSRIDEDDPDTVFEIQNQNKGPERVYAIRDYFKELVYFSYPYLPDSTISSTDFKFPNRIMVYNYRNDTFSFFDDCFTCFGYYQNPSGLTWATLPYSSWTSWTAPWNSGSSQALFPQVIAGNQQGYVFSFVDIGTISNDFSLSISGFTGNQITSNQHNLAVGRYIYIDGCLGLTGINGTIRQIVATTTNTITIDGLAPTGTYVGGGEIKPLSNFVIQTKQFTPFWQTGNRFNLNSINFLFDRTSIGEVVSNIFLSMGTNYSYSDSAANPAILGDNTVSTAPEPTLLGQILQDQIWHRQYSYAEGDTFQIQLSLNDNQMRDLNVNESDVVLHAMLFMFNPSGVFL